MPKFKMIQLLNESKLFFDQDTNQTDIFLMSDRRATRTLRCRVFEPEEGVTLLEVQRHDGGQRHYHSIVPGDAEGEWSERPKYSYKVFWKEDMHMAHGHWDTAALAATAAVQRLLLESDFGSVEVLENCGFHETRTYLRFMVDETKDADL